MSVADIPAGWSVRGDRFPLLQIAVQAFRVMKICSRRDFTDLNHCKKPRRSSTVAKSAGAVFFRERISFRLYEGSLDPSAGWACGKTNKQMSH